MLQNPDAWLKKECSIRQLSISLDQHLLASDTPRAAAGPPSATFAPAGSLAGSASGTSLQPNSPPGGGLWKVGSGSFGGGPTAHSYQPLLRISSIGVSALLPAFAWLEVGGAACCAALVLCCAVAALLLWLCLPGSMGLLIKVPNRLACWLADWCLPGVAGC